jgi:hypothetical protein
MLPTDRHQIIANDYGYSFNVLKGCCMDRVWDTEHNFRIAYSAGVHKSLVPVHAGNFVCGDD